ncbi:hypothetical protein [Raoultella sp. HC6]|uniref:hypothetical protein n=1 Tax=Raoultella sp. HC6 TaxID=2923366 RepID=UPI001F509F19|nr:hypothetical protein [Raoultella sp. HC6]
MPFYLTGNPVPSASVLDIRDNSQNLDLALNDITSAIWADRLGRNRMTWYGMESAFTVKLSDFESRFVSQIAEQETAFDVAQADKESRFTTQLDGQDARFDTFIASSGYDVIGDYTVGTIPGGNPLTVTEYNQLVRYNNELYKLTAATDIPFTTAGNTDETWTSTDAAHFVSVGDAALRQNLVSEIGGAIVGYRHSNIFDRLSSLLSLADIGVARPYLGKDESNDAIIANMFSADKDFDYMGIGSLALGKKLTGIRRNGMVLSLRGNQSGGDLFNPLISGVANSRGLRAYSSNGTDGVTLYGDISSLPYESWEDVESATYTENSIKPSDPDTWINAKIGDVIYTKHSTPCNGFITGKNSDGTLSVDEWADSGTTTTTPVNGVGFYLNPQNKIWTGNLNLFLPENGRATKGVIVEAGVRNNKTANSSEINGFDTVVLGGLYDCTAAYLSRGSGGKNWKFGFMAQGSKQSNFLSYAGVYAPRIGFFDQSGAAVGLRLMNTNTVASFELMNLANDTNHSEESTLVRWDTDGRVRKQALSISVVSTSVTLTSLIPNITVTALGITITLPTSSLLLAGHPIKIRVLGAGVLYFSSADGLLVEGFSTYTLHTVARGEYTAIYDGNSWVIFGIRGS